jgi:hypothetical protein
LGFFFGVNEISFGEELFPKTGPKSFSEFDSMDKSASRPHWGLRSYVSKFVEMVVHLRGLLVLNDQKKPPTMQF